MNLHLYLFIFLSHSLTQLDGYIARTWPTQKSALGSALDPLADKILISILYVSLTYAELIPGIILSVFVSNKDIRYKIFNCGLLFQLH